MKTKDRESRNRCHRKYIDTYKCINHSVFQYLLIQDFYMVIRAIFYDYIRAQYTYRRRIRAIILHENKSNSLMSCLSS